MIAAELGSDGGFTLVETLVVVVIILLLAALAFPNLLSQRRAARDAQAVSDLRNLIPVQIGFEAETGTYSDDPDDLTEWQPTRETIVCAYVAPTGELSVAAWHPAGAQVFSWLSTSRLTNAAAVPLPADCEAEIAGSSRVDPIS